MVPVIKYALLAENTESALDVISEGVLEIRRQEGSQIHDVYGSHGKPMTEDHIPNLRAMENFTVLSRTEDTDQARLTVTPGDGEYQVEILESPVALSLYRAVRSVEGVDEKDLEKREGYISSLAERKFYIELNQTHTGFHIAKTGSGLRQYDEVWFDAEGHLEYFVNPDIQNGEFWQTNDYDTAGRVSRGYFEWEGTGVQASHLKDLARYSHRILEDVQLGIIENRVENRDLDFEDAGPLSEMSDDLRTIVLEATKTLPIVRGVRKIDDERVAFELVYRE